MSHQRIHDCKIIVRLTDSAVFSRTGKHLSSTEVLVLEGTWKGLKYPQIATENGYASEYLRNDVGPKLWKRLSEAFEEKICKANVRIVLENHLLNFSKDALESDEKTVPNQSSHTGQLKNNNVAVKYPLRNLSLSNRSSLQPNKKTSIMHNLPHQGQGLIGRELEKQKLQAWLSSEQPEPKLCIEGIGGVGKTHLMLNIAYECLQTPQSSPTEDSRKASESHLFDAIVFVSSQSKNCTNHGLLPCLRREKNLWDIFRVILFTLGIQSPLAEDFDAACEQVYKSLMRVRVLLMIDNLDEFDNQQELLGFLYRLPSTVKVLVTSRRKTLFSSIPLYPLSDSEALRLVQYQIAEKNVSLEPQETEKLCRLAGGLPAIIILSIGLLSSGYSVQNISKFLLEEEGEFFQFYFAELFQSLRGEPAHRLLMTIALFPGSAVKHSIIAVAGLRDSTRIVDSFARLQSLFMIQKYRERYSVLPLIRSFVLAELEAHSEFELLARERWVHWYIDFINHLLGYSLETSLNTPSLDREWENLMEVIEWCIANSYYYELQQLWKIVKLYSAPCYTKIGDLSGAEKA